MKLRIDSESQEFLSNLAQHLFGITEDMGYDLEKLKNVFYQYSESLGPSCSIYEELVQRMEKTIECSSEEISEIAYTFKAIAYKMDTVLKKNPSYVGGNQIYDSRESLENRYKDTVSERMKGKSVNALVKDLYIEYESCIKFDSTNWKDTACYSPATQGIRLNIVEDLHNPLGAASTYFHEVGHLMDDFAGNGHTWLSDDKQFASCLRNDFDNVVQATMLKYNCNVEDAMEHISYELYGVGCANVSDIFGGLSGCMCQGSWGHNLEYWLSDSSNVTKEAFANMFEASMGNEISLQELKTYLPTAYSRFEEIIRSR